TGLLAVIVASFLFGTVFVPIKRVAAGDGFAAQFFLCVGGFVTSTVVHAALGFPALHGFAMVGGALWATANAFAIQIMNRLGMALSILVWNTLSCLTGWATSRYGLFGLPAAYPASFALNYMGITLLIIGLFLSTLAILQFSSDFSYEFEFVQQCAFNIPTVDEEIRKLSLAKRIGSFVAAMLSGLCYGMMWVPVNYMKNHLEDYPGASDESLPYLFSFFIGVLCTSVFIFTVYSIVKRSDPWVNASAILPSMSAGAIFAVAMTSFVIAIDRLQAAVAYPICSMAPGLVVSLWSILYFREI
ncbi:hypothetical protein Angca_007232, partial [Angiostrongylus cantonensis]